MGSLIINAGTLITIVGTLFAAFTKYLSHDLITNGEMFAEHNDYLQQKKLYYSAVFCLMLSILSLIVLFLYFMRTDETTLATLIFFFNMITLVFYVFISDLKLIKIRMLINPISPFSFFFALIVAIFSYIAMVICATLIRTNSSLLVNRGVLFLIIVYHYSLLLFTILSTKHLRLRRKAGICTSTKIIFQTSTEIDPLFGNIKISLIHKKYLFTILNADGTYRKMVIAENEVKNIEWFYTPWYRAEKTLSYRISPEDITMRIWKSSYPKFFAYKKKFNRLISEKVFNRLQNSDEYSDTVALAGRLFNIMIDCPHITEKELSELLGDDITILIKTHTTLVQTYHYRFSDYISATGSDIAINNLVIEATWSLCKLDHFSEIYENQLPSDQEICRCISDTVQFSKDLLLISEVNSTHQIYNDLSQRCTVWDHFS